MITLRIANVRHSDENFEGILLIGLAYSPFDFALDLRLALFAMAATEVIGLAWNVS